MVVDVASGNNSIVKQGSIGCGAIGGFFLIAGIVAGFSGEPGMLALMGAFGLVIIAIGLFPIIRKDVFLRPRRFVVDRFTIRWEDPKGAPWTLPWSDLSAVVVSTSGPRQAPDSTGNPTTYAELVRVDLYPVTPNSHPEIAHLWEFDDIENAYRVPLGPNPDLIAKLDTAFRTSAPPGIYRGVAQGDSGLF